MLRNIKILREARGISQQDLTEVIGMSQQSVNSYENQDLITGMLKLKKK